MPYYVISLAHTLKTDSFLTLWRPNNAGYCWSKENAGVYEEIEKGYHDGDGNLPVERVKAESMMIRNEEGKHCIPNTKAVWKMLSIKFSKGDLVKISSSNN